MTTSEPTRWSGSAGRRLVVVLAIVAPIEQVGFDMYAPALPKIAEHFGSSNALAQNTVTAYILGMALVVLPIGLVADAIGRKRVLLTGLSLMAVTSVGCAVATGMPMLLGLRFVQGMGAGTCLLLAATIAADCFRGAKLVSVLGILGAAWGAAPVLAPAAGGFIVQVASWRVVFVLLAAVVAAATLLVAVALPETLEADRRTPVDLRAAAGVLGEALRHRVFVAFTVMFGIVGAAQMVFGVAGPFLYQVGLGFASATYGFIALGVGAANFVGAAACGALAQRTSTPRLVTVGAGMLALGGLVLVVSAHLVGFNAWFITAGAAMAMLSTGVLDPLSKGLAMGVFKRNIGLVTGLINTVCYVSITLASALVAWLPESSQAPLGWLYVGAAIAITTLLLTMGRKAGETVQTPADGEEMCCSPRCYLRHEGRTHAEGHDPSPGS
ncbi:multidrug effflux MFS transporter [Mycobacterium sp. ITM-2016-00318]|uniref:multidrug effflux MFS transporter n=1 Tax=Mycobacterium sp. ITM-2016-00318 TaxID=2099693 RepID=UPI000CF9A028|nr:multidrug effflux MFS transporter [Mycobacterium sp. ITM-2016-00318]WNG92950.1 multidrug effflux MFS transporter [Mycobacterium sp. ITM-2016-00318]